MTIARYAALAFSILLMGCSVLRPLPDKASLEERLTAFPTSGLPLKATVNIAWNKNHIPFITAQHDDDLAFALGLVHAHLRLGQMEVLRRIASGRISEMAGPLTVDIDHALRILNFGRGADRTLAAMSTSTRRWINRFVEGVNHYQRTVDVLPHEFHVLGLKLEPWTARDVLTVGRLAGSDVNWLAYLRLLKLRKREGWEKMWKRLTRIGGDSTLSFSSDSQTQRLERLLGVVSRSGSNSYAVAGRRSLTGGALIASDPHLGISMPNLWILGGFKSPGFHAIGMMIPGVPFIAVGRNADIAWGGTNMRAASSDLFDASRLQVDAIRIRRERIKVRWWASRAVKIRETDLGPVISDAQVLNWKGPPFVLRWVGHEKGDEVTAMLKLMKARNFEEFRRAFATFAVSAQNMLYADRRGNIGQVMATILPIRSRTRPPDIILDPTMDKWRWKGFLNALQLPFTYNPAVGYLASANNKPTRAQAPVGWFFSANDRIDRLKAMLSKKAVFNVADMKAIQLDVYMQSSVAVRDAVVKRIDALGVNGNLTAAAGRLLDMMRRWDGHYRATDQEPVAFELVYFRLSRQLIKRRVGEEYADAYGGFAKIKRMIIEDLAAFSDQEATSLLTATLEAAGKRLDSFPTWGDMHRLSLAHPLSFAPVIGDRYRFGDFPANGSSESLMKTAHAATDQRHNTRYGQQARHITDMADLDRNWFLLLGGQDGWFSSSTAFDQTQLWQRGDYIQIPMRATTLRKWSYKTMVLQR